ncbi:MAG: acyl carrier protein [Acidobacteriota bacterium]|nr:MAG: acyl carrier protein [Acidobacteriota bacterium]
MSDVRQTLVEIVSAALPDGLPPSWDDARPLVEAGLNSIGVLTIVSEIEQRFGFKLADEELAAENFSTLAGLVTLIGSRSQR